MRNAFDHLPEIASRFSPGAMFMFDFDGTLAPIVHDPAEARLSDPMRATLSACAQRHPTAVISGRALFDVEKRVGVEHLWYAGSHGLEWKIDGVTDSKATPEPQLAAMSEAREKLRAAAAAHRGLIFEDKVHCAAINYRALAPTEAAALVAQLRDVVAEQVAVGLRILDGMGTFEIVPAIDWTKGECAQTLLSRAREKTGVALVPLYIGDSITDEDAFQTLRAIGVTIRVEEGSQSAAEFYVPAQDRVQELIATLCAFTS